MPFGRVGIFRPTHRDYGSPDTYIYRDDNILVTTITPVNEFSPLFIKDYVEFLGDDDGNVWRIVFDCSKDRQFFVSLHARDGRKIIFKKIAELEKEIAKMTERIGELEAAAKNK